MPRLDHSSYPHLLDAVIAYAEPVVLKTLRLTCHRLRDSVDARSARHLVLTDALRSTDGVLHIPSAPYSARSLLLLKNTRVLYVGGLVRRDRKAPLTAKDEAIINATKDLAALSLALPPLKRLHVYTIPCELFPLAETVVSTELVLLQPAAEHRRLVFFSHMIPDISTKPRNENLVFRVSEIVVLCPAQPMGQIARSQLAADMARMMRIVDRVEVGRIVLVDFGADGQRFVDTVVHVLRDGSDGQDDVDKVEAIDWVFLSRMEYAATLSDAEEDRFLGV